MINYDLPWSPLKVEQRIGRIHRFGQKKDCHIINFACAGTVAERVLEVLEKKIQIFEDAFGKADTMIGLLEDESSFRDCFKAFLSQKKTREEIDNEINQQLERAKLMAKKLNLLLSPEHMSYNMESFENSSPGRPDILGQKFFQALSRAYPDELEVQQLQNNAFKYSWDEIAGVLDFSKNGNRNNYECISPAHNMVQKSAARLLQAFPLGSLVMYSESKLDGYEVFLEAKFNLNRTITRLYSVFISSDEYSFAFDKLTSQGVSMKRKLTKIAVKQVGKQITKDLDMFEKRLRSSYGYWKENIENSALKRDTELKEKIDLQKSQMRWYGSNQGKVSALSRVQNSRGRLAVAKESKLWQLQDQLRGDVTVSVRAVVVHGVH